MKPLLSKYPAQGYRGVRHFVGYAPAALGTSALPLSKNDCAYYSALLIKHLTFTLPKWNVKGIPDPPVNHKPCF